jgi:hypothetical protein
MIAFESEFHVYVLEKPMTLYRGSYGKDRRALEEALSSNFQVRREPPHPAVVWMML